MRQTLFSWLLPHLSGARVLDLFAGSGVLGLESLSRGASFAHFVDSDHRVVRQLTATVQDLNLTDRISLEKNDAMKWLKKGHGTPWDVVFVDPPYADEYLYELTLTAITPNLSRDALVYVEHARSFQLPDVPLQLHKFKTIGEVNMSLLRNRSINAQP